MDTPKVQAELDSGEIREAVDALTLAINRFWADGLGDQMRGMSLESVRWLQFEVSLAQQALEVLQDGLETIEQVNEVIEEAEAIKEDTHHA
jgi:hypothetical protein